MNFKSTFILENDVVKLRPYHPDDFDYLLNFANTEPELWTYSLLTAAGPEKMKIYFEKALNDRASNTSYPFIVYDKRVDAYAGSTRFYDFQEGHNTVQLGYTWYGRDFQRTGLNRNCKFLMLQCAFEKWGLDRVEFRADATNIRSIEAMKAIGCTVEGVLRSNTKSLTGRRDSIVLSILKAEWFDHVRAHLLSNIKS